MSKTTKYILDLSKTPEDKELALVVNAINTKYKHSMTIHRTGWDDWSSYIYLGLVLSIAAFPLMLISPIAEWSPSALVPIFFFTLISVTGFPPESKARIPEITLEAGKWLNFHVTGKSSGVINVTSCRDLPDEFIRVVNYLNDQRITSSYSTKALLDTLGIENKLDTTDRKQLEGSVSLEGAWKKKEPESVSLLENLEKPPIYTPTYLKEHNKYLASVWYARYGYQEAKKLILGLTHAWDIKLALLKEIDIINSGASGIWTSSEELDDDIFEPTDLEYEERAKAWDKAWEEINALDSKEAYLKNVSRLTPKPARAIES